MKKLMFVAAMAVVASCFTGCTTATRKFADNETRQTVAGFAEADVQNAVSRAVQSILSQDRIKVQAGANRAVMVVENVKNDTTSRGNSAAALAQSLGQRLRKALTNSGKVVVFNKAAAQYATVRVDPQYHLSGSLTERNLRQDNGDAQREYNLSLTLIELATGLEFWQEDIHIGKIVDEKNINN